MAEKQPIRARDLYRQASKIREAIFSSRDAVPVYVTNDGGLMGRVVVRGRARRGFMEGRSARDTFIAYGYDKGNLIIATHRFRATDTVAQTEMNRMEFGPTEVSVENTLIIADQRVEPFIVCAYELDVVSASLQRLRRILLRENEALNDGTIARYDPQEFGRDN